MPVTVPPGRARLVTKPLAMGSLPAKTIGMVLASAISIEAIGSQPHAKITSGALATAARTKAPRSG